jgi:hypothetical protein
MELKDVILSTLAEMENDDIKEPVKFEVKETITPKRKEVPHAKEKKLEIEEEGIDSELIYLSSIKERLLVLFEGFQAPNNTNIEAKVDMTLNFLEYILATIDKRVEILEKGKK